MSHPLSHPGREKMARLARLADRISVLLLRDDYPAIDVAIAVENLRETALRMFPGSDCLFDMIYLARFRRLWSQFRREPEPPF